MKRVCLLFLLNSSLFAREVNGDRDIQLWLYQSFNKPVTKTSSLILECEQRFAGDVSVFYSTYVQLSYRMELAKWLAAAPGFRQTAVLHSFTGQRQYVSDPLLILFFKHTINKWEVVVRNQIQYRIYDNQDRREWLERVRTELFTPYKWGKMQLNPYVYSEFFFRERVGLSETRIAAALKSPIHSALMGSVHYMVRTLFTRTPTRKQTIIRLQLDVKF